MASYSAETVGETVDSTERTDQQRQAETLETVSGQHSSTIWQAETLEVIGSSRPPKLWDAVTLNTTYAPRSTKNRNGQVVADVISGTYIPAGSFVKTDVRVVDTEGNLITEANWLVAKGSLSPSTPLSEGEGTIRTLKNQYDDFIVRADSGYTGWDVAWETVDDQDPLNAGFEDSKDIVVDPIFPVVGAGEPEEGDLCVLVEDELAMSESGETAIGDEVMIL